MVCKVVNLKKEKYDVYIGRGSKWGNRFVIGRDGNREEVIRKYRDWILKNDYLLSCLGELKDKVLGCFCKPLACHGDVLVELVEKMVNENKAAPGGSRMNRITIHPKDDSKSEVCVEFKGDWEKVTEKDAYYFLYRWIESHACYPPCENDAKFMLNKLAEALKPLWFKNPADS